MSNFANHSSENTSNGRDGNGRWAKGNSGGPGNPNARHARQLRAMLDDLITPQMVEQVVLNLFNLAMAGNIPAARLFLQYAVGKPEKPKSSKDAEVDALAAMLEMMTGGPTTDGEVTEPDHDADACPAGQTGCEEVEPARAPVNETDQKARTPSSAPDQTVRAQSESQPLATGSNGSPRPQAPAAPARNGEFGASGPRQDPRTR
jgi:hypothetical protein